MNMDRILVHEDKSPITQLEGRLVKWLMKPEDTGGKYLSACIVQFEPGQRALPAHSHPNGEELVYIISGTGKVLIGDEIGDIKPGSIFLFPQGVPHMLYNTGKEVLKGICIYGPAQEATSYNYHKDVDFPEFMNTNGLK